MNYQPVGSKEQSFLSFERKYEAGIWHINGNEDADTADEFRRTRAFNEC